MLRAAATFAVTSLMLLTPALAGPNETAFLGKLVGTWAGSGQLKGDESGPVSCKLVFKKGTGGKVSYSGRCNVQDLGAQSFSGTLSYSDAKKVYEGRSGGSTVAGVKRGSSVVFSSKSTSIIGRATSVMTVAANKIVIDFTVTDSKGGKKSTSRITFSK